MVYYDDDRFEWGVSLSFLGVVDRSQSQVDQLIYNLMWK